MTDLLPCPIWPDPETAEEALEQSIEKWEYLSSGRANGVPDCGLCEFHYENDENCEACPVYAVTGKEQCGGSPFDNWHRAARPGGTEFLNHPDAVAAAQKELAFLKSLRTMVSRDEEGGIWCKRCWTEDEEWMTDQPAKKGDVCEDCGDTFNGEEWAK